MIKMGPMEGSDILMRPDTLCYAECPQPERNPQRPMSLGSPPSAALSDRGSVFEALGDCIREIENPDDLAYAAAELLGRSLGVSRAGYGTVDTDAETITITRDRNASGIKSLAGVLHFRDYGSYIEDLKRGETVICADAEKDPRVGDRAKGIGSLGSITRIDLNDYRL